MPLCISILSRISTDTDVRAAIVNKQKKKKNYIGIKGDLILFIPRSTSMETCSMPCI